jgi:transposase
MNTERSTSTENLPPLPSDILTLHAMIRELLDSLKKERLQREGVQQRLDLLLRKLYGPKAERFDPNQPWLLPEMAPNASADAMESPKEETPSDDEDAAKPKRHGHGRKPLPKDLPRRRVEHTLPESERVCPCCNEPCVKFGEDVSEQLDYQPASLFVLQHVRFKYACKKCHDHVAVAHAPIAVINKGLPGPGLLAQIAASKYADHLPLNRLERILGRHGVELSRSTMCDWMAHVAGLLQPLVDLMANEVRRSKALHTDATKMPFLDVKMPGKTLSGQMWVYVGDRDHPFDVFQFWRDHSAGGIDAFLQANHFAGCLNADAHNVYDHLFASGAITEVGCWAHARRHFHDAKQADPARTHVVLGHIAQLYAIEAEARDLCARHNLSGIETDVLRLRLRQEKSLPMLTTLRRWLEEEHPKVLPKSLMGQAIAYALRHWQALTRFASDGFLAIDNNIAERTLRHIALGRKNWLFAGSAAGAHTAATLFSIASSCHRHGVDVFAYLHDILQRPALPSQLRDRLPDRWISSTLNNNS